MPRRPDLHKRPMPIVLRRRAEQRCTNYRSNNWPERRLQRRILDALRDLKVWMPMFGAHWQWMMEKLRSGEWKIRQLMRASVIASKLQEFGLHSSLLKKNHFSQLARNPQGLDAHAWAESVDVALKELNLKIQEKEVRVNVVKRDDRPDETPVDADATPSLIVGDQIQRYDNIAVTNSFLGPFDLATGRVIPLRDDPGSSLHQREIPFPFGKRLFPDYLICPGTQACANLEPLVMAFDISGMIAQIPDSIRLTFRQTIADYIKRSDIRVKPSSHPSVNRLRKASKTKDGEVSVVDVVVVLAHAHWQGSFNINHIHQACHFPAKQEEDSVPEKPYAMSKKPDLIIECYSGDRFQVNQKDVFASPKLVKDVLLAKAKGEVEGMFLVKIRGEHPADQVKFVLSCLDAMAHDGLYDFNMIENNTISGKVGRVVIARRLFGEFGIEELGGLTAAADGTITDHVELLRFQAEHPMARLVVQSGIIQTRAPTWEVGPGVWVTRQIVAGARAVWEADPIWELGREKMLEAVVHCTQYLKSVPAFQQLMNDNTDFAAAFARETTGYGHALPEPLTAKVVTYHCKGGCGRTRQLSREPTVTTVKQKDILRRPSTSIANVPYMELWCDDCVYGMIKDEDKESMHPDSCLVCPRHVRSYYF